MPFTPIGETLDDSNQSNMKKQAATAQIVQIAENVFAEVFGKHAIHAKPLFLKNRTLTVTCSSSTVAQEIRVNQAKIVEKINEKLGKNEVDRIRYLA